MIQIETIAGQSPRKPKRQRSISLPIVAGILRVVDLGLIFIASELLQPILRSEGSHYTIVEILSILMAAIVFHLSGLYNLKGLNLRQLRLQLTKLTVGWGIVLLGLIVTMFFLKVSDEYSRSWMFLWFFCCLFGMGVVRALLVMKASDWIAQGRLLKYVAIAGYDNVLVEKLASRLQSTDGIQVIGYFDDDLSPPVETTRGSIERLGSIGDLIELARRERIDHIILALPWAAVEKIVAISHRLSILPIDISLAPDMIGFTLVQPNICSLGGLPLLSISSRPLSEGEHFAKTIFDYLAASGLVALFSPLLLMIAAAIKLESKGPVFFHQKRYGFNHELVDVWKFRTMYTHMCDPKGEKLTERNDPRVTRIGRILRRLSFDELPQLFNVLRGEMSLVGPRPHPISAKAAGRHYQEVVSDYAARHRVKPGITGWAQVNGWRGETATEEQILKRVEHDLFYIQNWSFALDLKILFMTAFTLFRHSNGTAF